jgi:hypothetical protein
MNVTDALIAAYKAGRHWDPRRPNLANLDRGRLAKMHGGEGDAQSLLQSLQMSDVNYDALVLAYHQRLPDFDGHFGPATERLLSLDRCPVPDFAPPPGAAIDLGDETLNAIAVQMQQREYAEAGSGSWPASGCDPERRGVHSIRIRIHPAGAPAHVVAYKDTALKAVSEAYADIGLAVRYLWSAQGACEIAKSFAHLRGGVIGINYFPVGGCTPITGQLSASYAPHDGGKLWANLECHETGHGVGLQHTRGHIMNPSIVLVWPLSWRGSPSLPALTRYFGGKPLVDRAPPTPAPAPVPPVAAPDGTLVLHGVTYEVRRTGSGFLV